MQLRDDPVAVRQLQLDGQPGRLAIAEAQAVERYAAGLARRQDVVLSRLAGEGIALMVNERYRYLFNGLALTIDAADRLRLEALPDVKTVYPDLEVRAMLSESVPLIGAPDVWEMQDETGAPITGSGARVAVLDTGIDYTHPDLGGCFGAGCKVVGGYDFVNGDADPIDDHGHGTHVAGIIAASGTITGVAPAADLYAYKVLSAGGWGYNSWIIAALERAVDPDGDPATDDGAHVINMSLGGGAIPTVPSARPSTSRSI